MLTDNRAEGDQVVDVRDQQRSTAVITPNELRNTGVSIELDPDLLMYGFRMRATGSGSQGPFDGLPIDLAGTGLGWGASIDEIEEAFPSNSTFDPLMGSMIIDTGNGLLQLDFSDPGRTPSDIGPTADAYLSVVRAGDFCSPGGVVTVGD